MRSDPPRSVRVTEEDGSVFDVRGIKTGLAVVAAKTRGPADFVTLRVFTWDGSGQLTYSIIDLTRLETERLRDALSSFLE